MIALTTVAATALRKTKSPARMSTTPRRMLCHQLVFNDSAGCGDGPVCVMGFPLGSPIHSAIRFALLWPQHLGDRCKAVSVQIPMQQGKFCVAPSYLSRIKTAAPPLRGSRS
jgi:hypothetical protein